MDEMDEETDLFKKIQQLEHLVKTHEYILKIIATVLSIAGYKDIDLLDEDKKG